MGRPRLYPDEAAMIVLPLRCTAAQAKRWATLARESKLDRSTWIRHTLDLGVAIEVQTQTTVVVKHRGGSE